MWDKSSLPLKLFGICLEKGISVPCEISQEVHNGEYISDYTWFFFWKIPLIYVELPWNLIELAKMHQKWCLPPLQFINP